MIEGLGFNILAEGMVCRALGFTEGRKGGGGGTSV
jgi:hypothetical protein